MGCILPADSPGPWNSNGTRCYRFSPLLLLRAVTLSLGCWVHSALWLLRSSGFGTSKSLWRVCVARF